MKEIAICIILSLTIGLYAVDEQIADLNTSLGTELKIDKKPEHKCTVWVMDNIEEKKL